MYARKVDLHSPEAAEADLRQVVRLLSAYACDPLGGAEDLPPHTKDNLGTELLKRANLTHVFLACYERDSNPIGLCICFENFSTFMCKGILNVHDVYVDGAYRGLGVASKMLAAAEETAIALGCCKLTLEVLTGNAPARRCYSRFGFSNYSLSLDTGIAEFWQKKL